MKKKAHSKQAEALPEVKRLRTSRFRVLPITMVMAVLLLGVKSNDMYRNGTKLSEMLRPSSAFAEDKKAEEEAMTKKEAAPEEEEMTVEKKNGETSESPDDVKLAKLNDDEAKPEEKLTERREFSQIEIDILQSLAERREELEGRSREIDLKEKLLDATEQRINDKLNEMKTLQGDVEKLLEQYNEKEDKKIRSLVKIYESMKPKDASTIFNELDMPILLEVVDLMSERKVAPILAGMNPEKARDVTQELAEFRKLRTLPRTVGTE